MISESVGKFLLQYPRARRHHSQNLGGNQLAAEAFVVCASEENAVAIALGVTLADNDVAVAVNLCGVHGVPLSVVNDCSA